MTKICAKCLIEQSLTMFHRAAGSPDGLQYYCKGCAATLRKRWEARNKPRVSELARLRRNGYSVRAHGERLNRGKSHAEARVARGEEGRPGTEQHGASNGAGA